MGMFDYIRSSYEFGDCFPFENFHTKDLCPGGIGGTMSQFWLSPSGAFFVVDYSHTQDFVEVGVGDPSYDEKKLYGGFTWRPNGKHGNVRLYAITDYIRMYPADWEGPWEEWPEARLHFIEGVLDGFEVSTRGKGQIFTYGGTD